MHAETLRFYPNFDDLSLLSKAILGANYTLLNHFLYESAKQFVIIPILTFYIVVQRKASKPTLLLSLFALSYTFVCILFVRGLGGDFAPFLNLDIYGTLSQHTASKSLHLHMLPIILGLITLFSLPLAWLSCVPFDYRFIRLSLCYYGGIFSSFILSFSPTIYASGYRVFFIPDMMMIIVILLLFMESLQHADKHKKSFTLAYLIISVMGVSKVLNLLT